MTTSQKRLLFKVCQGIIIGTIALISVLGLDILMPTQLSEDVVDGIDGEFRSRRSFSSESVKCETQRFNFPVHYFQHVNLSKGVPIQIEHTPIFKVVKKAYLPGKKIDVFVHNGLLDTFWWIPVLTLITAIVGIFFFRHEEHTISFGVVCLVLMVIILRILRIF